MQRAKLTKKAKLFCTQMMLIFMICPTAGNKFIQTKKSVQISLIRPIRVPSILCNIHLEKQAADHYSSQDYL
jgi:hypothetical protein